MAYVPKDWVTGEVITEQALDHIEQGIAAIGGGIVLLNVTQDGNVKHLGKSCNEIVALIENGTLPVAVETQENGKFMMFCAGAYTGVAVPGGPTMYMASFANPIDPTNSLLRFSAETATAELTYSQSVG